MSAAPQTPMPDEEPQIGIEEPETAVPHSLADSVREAPLTALMTAFIAGLFVGRLVL